MISQTGGHGGLTCHNLVCHHGGTGPGRGPTQKGCQLSEQPQEVELAKTATEARELANVWQYNPDMDFRKLALEAEYGSKGFRLVEKDDLLNVPHIIIGITYRQGFPTPGGKPGDYVSIEAVVADKDTLMTPPIRNALDLENLKVYGNEPVVYNDGSTGVRRQLTEQLHGMGIIDVGNPRKDENPFDRPFQEWASGGDLAESGIVADQNGVPFRYAALRGLRRSDYEWQGQPAHTHYIG